MPSHVRLRQQVKLVSGIWHDFLKAIHPLRDMFSTHFALYFVLFILLCVYVCYQNVCPACPVLQHGAVPEKRGHHGPVHGMVANGKRAAVVAPVTSRPRLPRREGVSPTRCCLFPCWLCPDDTAPQTEEPQDGVKLGSPNNWTEGRLHTDQDTHLSLASERKTSFRGAGPLEFQDLGKQPSPR